MPTMLEGKVALVTGGGGGIGRETVRVLAELGARVVVADVNLDAAEQTVEQAGGGPELVAVRTDVSDPDSAAAMVAAAVDRFGRLDIAHNNAGVELGGLDLADVDPEQYERVVAVNQRGVYLCMRAEIPQMLAQGSGSIINTASALGTVALPGQSAYVASKHGVIGLTKAAAMEYSARGIRINAVLPGVIQTPMIDEMEALTPGFTDMLLRQHPIGRLGTPTDVANAVAWLGSDLSAFVTASSLVVDGGYSAH